MANSKSAEKRARQSEKNRIHNKSMRSAMRTGIKNTLRAIKAGDKEKAEAAFRAAVPKIDRMATKGIIHQNKAARHKSRLNAKLKDMS